MGIARVGVSHRFRGNPRPQLKREQCAVTSGLASQIPRFDSSSQVIARLARRAGPIRVVPGTANNRSFQGIIEEWRRGSESNRRIKVLQTLIGLLYRLA
jgi:hypothetical protein